MNIEQFFTRAPSYIDEQYAIHLIGGSGVGKSASVAQLVQALGERDKEPWGLSTCLVGSMTPPDVSGFLMGSMRKIVDAKGVSHDVLMSEFSLPPWQISDTGVPMSHYRRGIVLFEEYGQGDVDVKRSLGEPVLHLRAGRHQLPAGHGCIMCSNQASSRQGVTKNFDFMINRTVEWHLVAQFAPWRNWAVKNKVHPLWITYAERNPGKVFTNELPEKQGPWCTPRSFVRFTRILSRDFMPGGILTEDAETRALMLEEGVAAIGEAVTEDLFTFCKVQSDVPTIEEVVKDPTGARLPSKPDGVFLISYMLSDAIDAKNVGQIATYAERLPREFIITFATAVAKDRTKRALVVSPAFSKKISAKNAAMINAIAAL